MMRRFPSSIRAAGKGVGVAVGVKVGSGVDVGFTGVGVCESWDASLGLEICGRVQPETNNIIVRRVMIVFFIVINTLILIFKDVIKG
jgi:hypothetical protein